MISRVRVIFNFLFSIVALLISVVLGKIIIMYSYGIVNIFSNIEYKVEQEILIMLITIVFTGCVLILLNLEAIIDGYHQLNLKKQGVFLVRTFVAYFIMFYVYALFRLFDGSSISTTNSFGLDFSYNIYPVLVVVVFALFLPVINEILFRLSLMSFLNVKNTYFHVIIALFLSLVCVLINQHALINNFILSTFVYVFITNFLLYRLYYRCSNIFINIFVAAVFNIILIIYYLI